MARPKSLDASTLWLRNNSKERSLPVIKELDAPMGEVLQDTCLVVECLTVGDTKWSLYCVCDGHGGHFAARFIKSKLPHVLQEKLPKTPPPFRMSGKDGRHWAKKVSKALAAVFAALDEGFAETATPSGATVSLALICGSLLTVANVGDSEVFLDVMTDILPLTDCHKVESNAAEQARLKKQGATISAFISNPSAGSGIHRGPLRVWPGGIAISRSIGDFDCSPHVIANPHITQAILPVTGSRLILASDGLWDHVNGRKACRLARRCLLSRAPTRLFRTLMSETSNALLDDTTILIVDILPIDGSSADFSLLCRNEKSNKSVWSTMKKFLEKFPGLKRKPMKVFSRLDTAQAFPKIKSKGHALYREATPRRSLSLAKDSFHRRSSMYNEATNKWNPVGGTGLLPQATPGCISAQACSLGT